jgi:transcriptional regulator with XRE-family HTH domain
VARGAEWDIRGAFGQAVRDTRNERGLSQEALAERAGLHRTYVSSLELGQRNVSLLNIERLAKALGITMSELTNNAERLL